MNMPKYKNEQYQNDWVEKDFDTVRFLRPLWQAASKKQKNDKYFLGFLVQCGWASFIDDKYSDTTITWRNRNLAEYLGEVEYKDDESLCLVIHREWPSISVQKARELLGLNSGITHYYRPFRTVTLEYIYRHFDEVKSFFEIVISRRIKPEDKIRNIVARIDTMPSISTPKGGKTSLLNAITPTLACLDPHLRFPIMNNQTKVLLRSIGQDQDVDGALALSSLIDSIEGITNTLQLDVYSQTQKDDFPKFERIRTSTDNLGRDVGIKSEQNSYGQLNRNKVTITKQHNKLINKFKKYITWRKKATIKEHYFDAVIHNWKEGRRLLIEAKTASDGLGGRQHVRQAVGQLFDYRYTYFKKDIDKTDIAILLPKKPAGDIISLLQSLNIEVLWFEKNDLDGTITL